MNNWLKAHNWLKTFALVLLLAFAPAWAARAQTYTVTATNVSLGNVAAPSSGSTTFTVNASTGAITSNPTGGLIGSPTGRSQVTVSCSAGGGNCNSAVVITVASTGTPSGRAGALQNFTASTTGGTATITVSPGTGNPISFTIQAVPNNNSRTFFLGFDLPIASTGATGSASSSFSVTAAKSGGGGTSGATTGSATATVFRALAISKTADLAFGKIIRPTSGSGTVALSAAGTRSVTGTGTFAFSSPSPTVAAFSVSGEGGQAVSVTIPATISLTSGANNLTVTTASTGGGTQTLSSTLGNAGSNPTAIRVGGSIPLTSTTPTGSYTGTFTVTVQYN